MLSNCGQDERGTYNGGQAGDQTGGEWCLKNYYVYSGGWQYVLRYPDANIGALIADLAIKAANNNHIGYDQDERYTFWENLADSNYDPSQITVNCEADCSAGVAAIVKAVGYLKGIQAFKNVSADCYTGNIRSALQNAGFQVLTDSKYLTSDAYLRAGDFLLKEGHHICTNVTNGSQSGNAASGGTSTVGGYSFTYCVQIDGKTWLPEVTNLNDFAGEYGHPITGICIKSSNGLVDYLVRNCNGAWNGKVCSQYANIKDPEKGWAGEGVPIDLFKAYFHAPKHDACAQYRTHLLGAPKDQWLDWQHDFNTDNGQDGYAGMKGRQIDGLQIFPNK